jgi:hypothetical protein
MALFPSPSYRVLEANALPQYTSTTGDTDPGGLNQHSPGAKMDSGKNRLGLVLGGFAQALQAVGEIGTFGANKYTDNGWMTVPHGQSRYMDAALRHQLKYLSGELVDPDSGLPHLAHLAWNVLAVLELSNKEETNGNET